MPTRFASKEALGELLKSWAPSYELYAGMFDRGICDLVQLANASAGTMATLLAKVANQPEDIQHRLHAEDMIARATGRSAHEVPPGTDASALSTTLGEKLGEKLDEKLDPICKALERTSRSTIPASDLSSEDLTALRGSVGANVRHTSSDNDPEALDKLLATSPTNIEKVWRLDLAEPKQRDMYSKMLQKNVSASPRRFKWVDATNLVVKLQVRGHYFKVASRNDELLIIRSYSAEPTTGAVFGFELNKALTKEKLNQAEAEFYIFAHHSMFPYAQFYTDLTTGAAVFYSDKRADGKMNVTIHTLVGMSAVWEFANAMLCAMPEDLGQGHAQNDDFLPEELMAPKRIKLTAALSHPVSKTEAVRLLCGIQSYDVACLDDLDDPDLYAQDTDMTPVY